MSMLKKDHATVKAEYTITEGEYVRANKLFSRLEKKHWLFYAIAIAAIIAIAVFAHSEIIRFGAVFALTGGIAGHLISRHVYAPWQTRRLYSSYAAVKDPASISLTKEGIRFISATSESLVTWRHLMKWRENNEFVLVYQNPKVYHIIPKRLSSQGFNTGELAQQLEANVGVAT